jgi:probable addiction module antidote protein
MTIKTREWDASEHLETPEDVAEYLTAAFEDGDPKLVAAALGDIARSKGMAEVARTAGLSRESLYRGLSEGGNPSLATVMAVAKAVGLKLAAHPADQPEAA